MKKQLLLLWMSLYPIILLAQISAVTQETSGNNEFKLSTTHEILFQLRSTQTPFLPGSSTNPAPIELRDIDFIFSPDTTWTYDEMANHNSTIYQPKSFSQQFDLGDENTFTRNTKTYSMNVDSARWQHIYFKTEWFNTARLDSSINMRFDESGTPTYGDKYYHIYPPADEATSEIYHEVYRSDSGWEKNNRSLTYNSEDNSLNWSKTYRYDPALMEYLISYENLFEDKEDHLMYENKSYTNGQLMYWNRRYEKFDENHNTIYTINHLLNSTKDALIPSDSTAYVDAGDFAEAKGFLFKDGKWELNTYSCTFEHASELRPDENIIDSVLTFSLIYDAEVDSMVANEVVGKSEYVYDTNENMIEYLMYYPQNGELIVTGKYTTEYEFINNEYYATINRSYDYSYTSGGLYLYSEWHTLLDEFGGLAGDLNLYFSEAGDTTYGYKSLMYEDETSFYSFNFDWSPDLHDFIKTGFMMHFEGEPITQYAYVSAKYSSDRSVIVMNSMPAAVNPGPIFPVLGDTLDIIISAYNPDMTHPILSAENLPASATFDPDTRRLYWEVDEEVDRTFTITATNNSKSTSIDVYLVFGEFTVDSEMEADQPTSVVLYQNFPNPFNPNTTISFELLNAQYVTLRIFNVLGQTVETLVQNELMTTGVQRFNFNAKNLSSGVYYYRLDAGELQFTKKMTLIK